MRSKKKVVVDSSVIVKWLSSQEENHLAQADKLLRDAQAGKIEIYTSELSKFEVANALLKGKLLDIPQAKATIATLYSLPITYISDSQQLTETAYKLGFKLGTTYYDSAFLAITQQLKATLVTDNIKHQGKSVGVRVIPLSDY